MYAGWRAMDTGEWKELDQFLFAGAMEHDSPKLLFRSHTAADAITDKAVPRTLDPGRLARQSL